MKRYIVFMVALLVFHSVSLLAIAKRYQLVDLGLQKYASSEVLSFNKHGVVCGYVMDGDNSHIFVVDTKKKNKLALRKEDFFSYRLKINNHNEVFGSIAHRIKNQWEFSEELIFKWINPFNPVQDFKHVGYPKGRKSTAHHFKPNVFFDANDKGQILVMSTRGYADALKETAKNVIWLYDNEMFQKIEHPQFEAGYKLNNHGEILGCYHTGSSASKDRVTHVAVYNYAKKTVRTINLPGDAVGDDINDHGEVVGNFYYDKEDTLMGFLASAKGDYTPLVNFWPYRMNNKGQVIGQYFYGEKQDKPAVWENGVSYDLADLVGLKDNKGKVWESLDTLIAINDKGEIIGNGTVDGKTHGFLLKPVD